MLLFLQLPVRLLSMMKSWRPGRRCCRALHLPASRHRLLRIGGIGKFLILLFALTVTITVTITITVTVTVTKPAIIYPASFVWSGPTFGATSRCLDSFAGNGQDLLNVTLVSILNLPLSLQQRRDLAHGFRLFDPGGNFRYPGDGVFSHDHLSQGS